MKISTTLSYVVIVIYTNLTFAYGAENYQIFSKYKHAELKNLIIHENPKLVSNIYVIDNDGSEVVIKTDQDKVLLINFWATWCAPCLEEMPSLNKLVETIGSENFILVTIASGRQSKEKIAGFLTENNIHNLINYIDPKGTTASKLGILGLPTTIIVDKNSNEIGRLIGGTDWNSIPAINLINFMLAQKASEKK